MYCSTKLIELGSCAFRQPLADSHCKYLHGYHLTAKFWFTSDKLDKNNWVVDFGGLKGLKEFLRKQFDHTTCISTSDPHVDKFKKLAKEGICDLRLMDGVGIEKFAEFCHASADNFVALATDMRCRCTKVELFEHDNNSAIYMTPVEHLSTPEVNTSIDGSLYSRDVKPDNINTPPVDEPNSQPPPATESKAKDQPKSKIGHDPNKTVNTWVNPKFKKTTNSWLF